MNESVQGTGFGDAFSTKHPIRIVVVDDSSADAELMISSLRRERLPVAFEQVDTPERLQQCLLAPDTWDIVLSDHNLRFWTANDALDILHRSGQDIPFIVVTGTLGDEKAVEYLKRGASDYILKERLETLPAAILRALEQKRQRDQNRKLQEEIKASKEAWERTFDAIPDSIMLLDRDRCIVRANAATSELLGKPLSEIVGRRCFNLNAELGCPPAECPWDRTAQTGKEEEAELTTPHTAKILRVSTVPLRNSAGELDGAIHIMRDITERKQLEQVMLQSQKLEAIGRLAGGVAHDFNNILGVIQGHSELMEERIEQSDGFLQRHIREIRKAALRAAGVTRQLLAFSRKQVMQLKPVKLNEVVVDLAKMLRNLIGENIELEIRTSDDLGLVKADPVQIQQVLMNLAINARDAMPSGGRLTITTSNTDLDSNYPRLNDPVVPGRYVLVSVCDNGTGMDQETVSHIFEPFFTTKGPEKGTGFGLSIVYGIVKQSGGYIWVYSEHGHGTTFKIYLPRLEESVAVPPPITVSPTEMIKGNATVLLVEDEEALAEMVTAVLESTGYTILYANTGEKALEIARIYDGNIHLLLSDVILRGTMNGFDVARALSDTRPDTKVLFMSGYNDALNRAEEQSDLALLEKPFTNAELRGRVQAILKGTREPESSSARGASI